MNWDDIRFFLTLARQGSLSAAARTLEVEHSTVARRITTLEQDLKVKLFKRLARGWTLTAEGGVLLDQAQRIEEETLALQRAAHSQTPLAGRVRVSAPPLLLNHFVLPHLNGFRDTFPQIELELLGQRRGADLGRGEADIALRLFETQEPDLIIRRLGEVSYHLYATPEHGARPENERVFIGFSNSMSSIPQKAWLERHIGTRPCALRVNDMAAMREAAGQGWGIALLPRIFAAGDARLVHLPVPEPPPPSTAWLVMHRDMRRSPRIRHTADYLIALFKEHAAAL